MTAASGEDRTWGVGLLGCGAFGGYRVCRRRLILPDSWWITCVSRGQAW